MDNKKKAEYYKKRIAQITFDKKEKFVYLNIEKNAQTSLIRGALSDRCVTLKDDPVRFVSIECKLNKGYLDDKVTFAIYRDPFQRFVSTYNYLYRRKVIRESIESFIETKIDTQKRRHKLQRTKNFNVWDHHLNPQWPSFFADENLSSDSLLPDCVIILNQNFSKNFNHFLIQQEIVARPGIYIPHKNKTSLANRSELAKVAANSKKFCQFYQKDIQLERRLRQLSEQGLLAIYD